MAMGFSLGMNDISIPIDEAGRIVLPKCVREELAVKPGDTLKVAIHGSSVILTPNKEQFGFIRKGKALVFSSPGPETLDHETVRRILEEERAQGEKALARRIPERKRRV